MNTVNSDSASFRPSSLDWASESSMHVTDRLVRIIKREHRHLLDGESGRPESSLKTENEVRREIRTTITSWVENQRETKKELYRQSSLSKRESYASRLFADVKQI